MPVQGRRSQSYEPLLLENEREAVADLLQYLESTSYRIYGFGWRLKLSFQIDRLQTSSKVPPSPHLQRFLSRTMSTFRGVQRWPLQRSLRRKSSRLAGTPWTPSCFSSVAMTRRYSGLRALLWATLRSIVSLPLITYRNCLSFASLAENKLLIVKLGGLEPLIRQMLSPNVEVQCNAVGCVTNLATHGQPRLAALAQSIKLYYR